MQFNSQNSSISSQVNLWLGVQGSDITSSTTPEFISTRFCRNINYGFFLLSVGKRNCNGWSILPFIVVFRALVIYTYLFGHTKSEEHFFAEDVGVESSVTTGPNKQTIEDDTKISYSVYLASALFKIFFVHVLHLFFCTYLLIVWSVFSPKALDQMFEFS